MKLDGVQAAEKIRSLRKTTAGSIHVMALAAGKQKERYLFFVLLKLPPMLSHLIATMMMMMMMMMMMDDG